MGHDDQLNSNLLNHLPTRSWTRGIFHDVFILDSCQVAMIMTLTMNVARNVSWNIEAASLFLT
ncbi:MAG: hypothetical protein OJF51_002162 [Nitrospira sp.]|jgi:hypothetical protein|nr:MAG: hypothetical protein OJF51_002162 [Nitrospira sp.]